MIGPILLLAGAWALMSGKGKSAGSSAEKSADVKRLQDRIVNESKEILRGERDAYTEDEPSMAPPAPTPEREVPRTPGVDRAESAPGEVVEEALADGEGPAEAATEDDVEDMEDMEGIAPGGDGAVWSMEESRAARAAESRPLEVVEEAVLDAGMPLEELRAFASWARLVIQAGKGAQLGTRGAPSARVSAVQRALGISDDGVYGPQTRAALAARGVNAPVRK